jgi:hypothetical protein
MTSKSEARSPKSETISNDQNPNDRNPAVGISVATLWHGWVVSVIGTFELRICFEFRYSDFEFILRQERHEHHKLSTKRLFKAQDLQSTKAMTFNVSRTLKGNNIGVSL